MMMKRLRLCCKKQQIAIPMTQASAKITLLGAECGNVLTASLKCAESNHKSLSHTKGKDIYTYMWEISVKWEN